MNTTESDALETAYNSLQYVLDLRAFSTVELRLWLLDIAEGLDTAEVEELAR